MFRCPPWSDLNLDVSKDSVLECSGLDFGGLGPRFWSLRASILEVPGPTCRTKETHFGAFKFKRPKMQTLGLGFGRLRASILKARAWAFKKCKSFKNPTDYRRGRCSKVGRRRWSPNGGFNESAASAEGGRWRVRLLHAPTKFARLASL